MKTKALCYLTALLFYSQSGCYKTSAEEQDSNSSTRGTSDADGDADSDADTDAEVYVDTDSSPKGDSDGDVDTDTDSSTEGDTDTDTDGDTDSSDSERGGSIDTQPIRDTDTIQESNGKLVWVIQAGGPLDDGVSAIVPLQDESFWIVGRYADGAVFGEDDPSETVLSATNEQTGYLAKYHADGTLDFVKPVAGGGETDVQSVAAAPDGAIWVVGEFSGTAEFEQGEPSETTLIATDWSDIFIARYHFDGALSFVTYVDRTGSSGHQVPARISVADDGTIWVLGRFEGTAVLGADEPNETTLESAGGVDLFIAKYNADGSLNAAKRVGGDAGEDVGYSLSVQEDGAVWISGVYWGDVIFGRGEVNETVLTSINNNVFIAKYNADGTLAQAQTLLGTEWGWEPRVAALADGSLWVTGMYYGNTTLDPGGPNESPLASSGQFDLYLARYQPDGALVSASRIAGTGWDEYSRIAVSEDDTFWITGMFQNTVVFGEGGVNETPLTASTGGYSRFIAKYRDNGTLAFVKETGASQEITAESGGSAWVIGTFGDTATFGKGEPNEVTLTTRGEADISVAKYR